MTDQQVQRCGDHTVTIERDLCIGSGNCVNLAPEVFELDDRQIVTFTEEPAAIDPERLAEACRVCPVEALRLENEAGEQIVP